MLLSRILAFEFCHLHSLRVVFGVDRRRLYALLDILANHSLRAGSFRLELACLFHA